MTLRKYYYAYANAVVEVQIKENIFFLCKFSIFIKIIHDIEEHFNY